jgi:hypothetical protein
MGYNTGRCKADASVASKILFVEALGIYSKIYGPNHSDTVDASSQLTIVLRELIEQF